MKRIKNLVIGGIENKIFNLIIYTVILLTAAFTAVSVYHGRMLSRLTAESSKRQQDAVEEITGTVMDSVIDNAMGRSTLLEAYIVDEMFHSLQTRVEMLGEYAEKLCSAPGEYPRMDFAAPDPGADGEVVTQLIPAPGVSLKDPALLDRIGLAANMSDLMESLFGVSEQTNSCFIALPEGVFLVTDDRSGTKYDEKGKLLDYDPRTRPWYRQAVEKKGLIFTDVETDAFTGDIGIVCAMPVYVDGKLAAVVGSDLFLTSMQKAVLESDENGSYVTVINNSGHVVFSPRTEGEFRVLPASSAEDLRASENPELAKLVRDAMEAQTDMRTLTLSDGADYYVIGAPMKTVGWTLLSICSKEAAMQPAVLLKDSMDGIQADAVRTYEESTKHSQATAQVLFILAAVLTLTGALVLGKRIVRPLNTITKRISRLSEGNLEFKMEDAYRTGDEIEELAESFASLSHKTVEYVGTVRRVTAEKERIGTELALATDIQAAMLPHIFPPFPGRAEFDIFASMDPAKEVGGDFFDYFLVDDDHLCMVIADVSGKGVPAALFMMASKIILQSNAMLGSSPSEVLARTNEALCAGNEAQMFVTVWLGILELSTGKLRAANAGHEYPVMKKPDGSYALYKDRHSFVIGGMEGMEFREYELQLIPGTSLFFYTDGVPEATDSKEELYGTDRLVKALNQDPEAAPQEVLSNVRKDIDAFVQDAEQFDDLTMLCLRYNGPAKTPDNDR